MRPARPLRAYGLAVLLVALAAAVRQALDPTLGDDVPFVTFFLSVLVSSWYGGPGPGLLAALLTGLAANWLFVPPRYSLVIGDAAHTLGTVMYFLVCLGIVAISFAMRRAERRARERERALRASEERFRSLVTASAQVIWGSDADGLLASESKSWQTFTGQSFEESRGAGWLDAVHPDDRERVLELWSRAIAARSPVEMEYRLRRPDGSYTWTLARAAPLLDEQGGVREWIGALTDISDRTRALEAQTRLAAIVESSADAIVGETLDGVVTSWNRGAERIFGYRAEEMVGQSLSRLAPPGRSDELPSILAAIRRGERVDHFETERIKKDGQRIHVSLSVSPLVDSAGKVIGASKIARDVTDRKRAEERLRESKERTQRLLAYSQAILTNMAEGLYTVDTEGRVTFINPAAERLFGWRREELLGQRMHDMTHYQHADGRPFPVEECAGFQVLQSGAALRDHEDVFIRKDGSFFPVVYSSSPILFESRVEGLAVVFRDVTEEKQAAAERERLLASAEAARAEAEAADRAKDAFLSLVSHELRTPLSAMLTWLQVLRSGEAAPRERALESMQRSLKLQAKLVEDLLDVSRIVSGGLRLELRPVPLADVVSAALGALRPAAEEKGIRLESKLAETASWVAGDAERLQQILWNLLSNALKFTPAGGLVQVGLETNDGKARLVVRDTGRGIPPKQLARVFDRFWQGEPGSRREGGLGLGLAIVRHLVELHGGQVSVESAGAGRGTTFTVELPLLSQPRGGGA